MPQGSVTASLVERVAALETRVVALETQVSALITDMTQLKANQLKWAPAFRFPLPPLNQ